MTKSDTDIPASKPAEKQEEDSRSVLDYVDPVDPILTMVVRHDAPCQSAVDAAAEVKGATLGEAAGSVIKHIVVGIVDNIDI